VVAGGSLKNILYQKLENLFSLTKKPRKTAPRYYDAVNGLAVTVVVAVSDCGGDRYDRACVLVVGTLISGGNSD
jgi:hypothetical protein